MTSQKKGFVAQLASASSFYLEGCGIIARRTHSFRACSSLVEQRVLTT